MADGSSAQDGYLKGVTTTLHSKNGYLQGSLSDLDDIPSYLFGVIAASDSTPAYLAGLSNTFEDYLVTIHAYTEGVMRSSILGYTEGLDPEDTGMAEYSYIWLKTEDLVTREKFRVIAAGYDDGTLDKAESLERTIGGGINHSMGAVYKSWAPTIRVRQLENETNYGDLDDLKYFYSLNDPGATPSPDLIFVDHHGEEFTVHTVGTFGQSLMGVKTEGLNAWFLVKLRLIEV